MTEMPTPPISNVFCRKARNPLVRGPEREEERERESLMLLFSHSADNTRGNPTFGRDRSPRTADAILSKCMGAPQTVYEQHPKLLPEGRRDEARVV